MKPLNLLLLGPALYLTLAGQSSCVPPGGPGGPITEPPQVQTACELLTLEVPVAEQFKSQLTPAEQNLLAQAEDAVLSCTKGDATTAIIDIEVGVIDILINKGVTPTSPPAAQKPALQHRLQERSLTHSHLHM